MTSCVALALLALVATASSGRVQAALAGVDVSAPVLAWSNRALLDGSSASVYESAQAGASTASLVLGAIGKAGASSSGLLAGERQHADLAVVFLGSQVDASVLRQAKALQPMKQLSGVLGAAGSSLVLPFLKQQGASLLQELQQLLQTSDVGFQAVGCNSQEPVEDLAAEVTRGVQTDSGLQVLLVCPSTSSLQGSTVALQAEVDQLQVVQAAAQAAAGADKHVVFVYANQPFAASRALQARRRMQSSNSSNITFSGFGPYTECGPMCITQVAWLTGIIAALFLGFAACSGLACLYLVNGPTRFETVKDNAGGSS